MNIYPLITIAAVTTCHFVAVSRAYADPTQWPMEHGGNGHWYEAVNVGPFTPWPQARDLAEARGGHLATITSAGENAFIYELIRNRPDLWTLSTINNGLGPWLGAMQDPDAPVPSQGWQWITGEPWDYQNWSGGEPSGPPFNGQIYIQFFSAGQPVGPLWNDTGGTGDWDIRGYIAEYEVPPPLCPDVSGDGVVNFIDITSILSYWGTTSSFGDADGSGTVDFADITAVLAHWGEECP